MRRRTSGLIDDSDSSDSSDLEDSIQIAHPDSKGFKLPSSTVVVFFSRQDSGAEQRKFSDGLKKVLFHLAQGNLWWARFFAIFVAATLTYSYKNASRPGKTNVQIAIMTVITLVGASPLPSSYVLPAAIGAFVGGQNIFGSTGPMEDNTVIHPINYAWLLLLSLVVGVCFEIFKGMKILDGYAGRLGTMTFAGMNIAMVTIYAPLGVVDWDRYWYGFSHIIHMAEEDSALPLSTAWSWTEEIELAIGYVVSVVWLGWVSGLTRVLHQEHIQKQSQNVERDAPASVGGSSRHHRHHESSSSPPNPPPPPPLNNVTVPVMWALLSMLVVNATEYRHSSGLYNGFAVGSYVGMASLQKIASISRFVIVSLLASFWGLAMTPVFVGFAGKSGFTAMLGHATYVLMEKAFEELGRCRTIQHQIEEEEKSISERLQRRQSQSLVESMDSDEEDPPSPPKLEASITSVSKKYVKPKEALYTKQQRRQHQRLKHMQRKQQQEEEGIMLNENSSVPKIHHRAWSTASGDDPWRHPMGESGLSDISERHNVV